MNLTKQDGRARVVRGLGGALLFLIAGYAAVMDILTYFHGRPLLTFNSKMDANNDFGIFITGILIILSLEGLISLMQQVQHVNKNRHKV